MHTAAFKGSQQIREVQQQLGLDLTVQKYVLIKHQIKDEKVSGITPLSSKRVGQVQGASI